MFVMLVVLVSCDDDVIDTKANIPRNGKEGPSRGGKGDQRKRRNSDHEDIA